MKVLITGSAGFIGHHLVLKLIKEGHTVVGLDSLNDYYDVNLKYARLNKQGIDYRVLNYGEQVPSTQLNSYSFYHADLSDQKLLDKIFKENLFDVVCNLAAQAGVRYSIDNPHA